MADKMEIEGVSITYSNLPELREKLQAKAKELVAEVKAAEDKAVRLRKARKGILRFLGEDVKDVPESGEPAAEKKA